MKISYQSNKQWISVSSIYNFINNDILSDVFKEVGVQPESKLFRNKLFENGNKFEAFVLDDIKKRTGIFIPTVAKHISEHTLNSTLNYMKSGVPIIHSAPLIHPDLGIKGIADLLVRSDCFHLFFKTSSKYPFLTRKEQHHGCDLSSQYHYIVIDIKYTTIKMLKNSILIEKTNKTTYYKSQLYLYNQALGYFQGYTPQKTFVLGRVYKSNEYAPFYYHSLGMVDYASNDAYISLLVNKSLRWRKLVMNNANNWISFIKKNGICPIVNHEFDLAPNYSNSSDYQTVKKVLVKKNNDITKIWFCNEQHRKILDKNNIDSFLDPRCTAELLGFTGKRKTIIDAILNIQRSPYNISIPDTIQLEKLNVKSNKMFFIDFETIPNVLSDKLNTPERVSTDLIYLIGCGYLDNNNFCWKYYLSPKLSETETRKIIKQFINNLPNNAVLYHWGFYEQQQMKKYEKLTKNKHLEWVDLCKLFTDTPVTIKGCFDFNLKHIISALNKHNLIQLKYTNISSGDESGVIALENYKNKKDNWTSLLNYNKLDCEALYELIKLVKKN